MTNDSNININEKLEKINTTLGHRLKDDSIRLRQSEQYPLYVDIIDKKEVIDIEEFDLSKDTKFTIRTLLSYCLFIIAVYWFELKFRLVGLGLNVDNSTNMLNLAEFSFWLIFIHIIILVFYFWRDKLNLKNKEKRLKDKIKPLEEIYKLELSILKSIKNKNIFESIELIVTKYNKLIKRNNKTDEVSSILESYFESKNVTVIKELETLYNEKKSNNITKISIDELDDNKKKLLKDVESFIKNKAIATANEYHYYKSINTNKNWVMYGINVAYPLITSFASLILLCASIYSLKEKDVKPIVAKNDIVIESKKENEAGR